MTELLQQAIDKARRLPDTEQDVIARHILDEIESDRRWVELVAGSPDALAELADRAWAEHQGGGSKDLDPDVL